MKKWLFPVLSAVLLITVITHTELVRNYSERSCYVKGFHMGGTASGAKSGWGIYVYLDGSVYVGNFRHNQIHTARAPSIPAPAVAMWENTSRAEWMDTVSIPTRMVQLALWVSGPMTSWSKN